MTTQTKRSWLPIAGIGFIGLAAMCGAARNGHTTDTAAQTATVTYNTADKEQLHTYMLTVIDVSKSIVDTMQYSNASCGNADIYGCSRDIAAARRVFSIAKTRLNSLPVDDCFKPSNAATINAISKLDDSYATVSSAPKTQQISLMRQGLDEMKTATAAGQAASDQLTRDIKVCGAKYGFGDNS